MKYKYLIIIVIMSYHSFSNILAANSLWNHLSNSYVEKVTYKAPSEANIIIAQNLFKILLTNRVISNSDIESWKKLGFSLFSVAEFDNHYAIIKEDNPRGYGFYVVKLSGFSFDNILEAPHRPSDLYTHEIIYKLLLEGNFVAAAINSTNRQNVDLSKEIYSYYNSFTNAVAGSFDKPKLLQLHAFETEDNNITGDVILSSTKKELSPIYNQIAACLKNNLIGSKTFTILQYPKDIQNLGGTLNINAKNFYQTNPNGLFFHVETSKALRDEMRSSSNLRMLFYKCFLGL